MKIRLLALFVISGLSLNFSRAADPAVNSGTSSSGTAPAVAGAQVGGQCTIGLKIGTKQYLAKMGIAVVPADAEEKITKARNESWRLRASRANYGDGFNNLDLNAIGGVAVKLAVQTVQTDAEGKYQIRGLAPGDYLLYSQYHSRYAVAYWLIPLTVKSDRDQITIDINNSNMKEVYNIRKEQW